MAGRIHPAKMGEKSKSAVCRKGPGKLLPAEQGEAKMERPDEDGRRTPFQIICVCKSE